MGVGVAVAVGVGVGVGVGEEVVVVGEVVETAIARQQRDQQMQTKRCSKQSLP